MFIKTREYLEFEEDMKELLHLMKNPANIVMAIFMGLAFLSIYFGIIILADIVQGVLQ